MQMLPDERLIWTRAPEKSIDPDEVERSRLGRKSWQDRFSRDCWTRSGGEGSGGGGGGGGGSSSSSSSSSSSVGYVTGHATHESYRRLRDQSSPLENCFTASINNHHRSGVVTGLAHVADHPVARRGRLCSSSRGVAAIGASLWNGYASAVRPNDRVSRI
jgi:hypothetical protein